MVLTAATPNVLRSHDCGLVARDSGHKAVIHCGEKMLGNITIGVIIGSVHVDRKAEGRVIFFDHTQCDPVIDIVLVH